MLKLPLATDPNSDTRRHKTAPSMVHICGGKSLTFYANFWGGLALSLERSVGRKLNEISRFIVRSSMKMVEPVKACERIFGIEKLF
jgi:hypothetical protein